MLPAFVNLPPELKLKIVRKCQAVPYVRLRQACRFMDNFCEEHRRFIGIYIYRKTPELFLVNSLKETYPFNKQIKEDEEDIDEPYAVVEFGRYYGQANLKLPMRRETLPALQDAISGFNFPEISILNHNEPDDEEGNATFSGAFELFMEVLMGLHVVTLNIKGLTVEQYETAIQKLPITYLRLRRAKINTELVETDFVKKIRHFSCTFILPPANIDFQALLKNKSIGHIDWGSQDNSFNWSSFEKIMANYEDSLPELYFYRFYFEDEAVFYKMDMESKEGKAIPNGAFHIGPLKIKAIPNANVVNQSNHEMKYDYWLKEIGTNSWMLITVSRKSWSYCTDVCVLFDTLTSEEDLNLSFLSMLDDDLLLHGYVIDFSEFYEKIKAVESLEEKQTEMLAYLEYIPSLYL